MAGDGRECIHVQRAFPASSKVAATSVPATSWDQHRGRTDARTQASGDGQHKNNASGPHNGGGCIKLKKYLKSYKLYRPKTVTSKT